MTDTIAPPSCAETLLAGIAILPESPFYSLNYHFGMLLGVDDFDTEKLYHLGKMRLHNAWLHGDGAVWGFGVQLDKDRGEIRVLPGLALDIPGHELHLDAPSCLNVGQWLDVNRKDPNLKVTETDTGVKFDAHVTIRFKACLARQVPAMLEPCSGANVDTTYSRVYEIAEILLKPGSAPEPATQYHRLRVLFGIEPPRMDAGAIVPADQDVLAERERIAGLDLDEQAGAWLAALRRFAALDEIDMQPALAEDGSRLLFPGPDTAELPLANITGITLERAGTGWRLTAGGVDATVRPSHVSTRTIQELLVGALGTGACATSAGPRIDSALFDTQKITLSSDADLAGETVSDAAFSVSWLDASGWHPDTITGTHYDGKTRTITLDLQDALSGSMVRLIARGTGPTPLLGTNMVPLAGSISSPPAPPDTGVDFVLMHKRS